MRVIATLRLAVLCLGCFALEVAHAQGASEPGNEIITGTLITSNQSGNLDLFRYDNGEKSTELIATDDHEFDAVPSPDGKHIAFVRAANNADMSTSLWIADTDGSNAHQLITLDPNKAIMCPDWHPDGNKIAYSVNHLDTITPLGLRKMDIHVIDIESGQSEYMVDGTFPDWSPDGASLLYTIKAPLESGEVQADKRVRCKSQIAILDLKTGSTRVLYSRHGWFARWNPEGDSIALIERSLTGDHYVGISILHYGEKPIEPTRIPIAEAYPLVIDWVSSKPNKILFAGIHADKDKKSRISVFELDVTNKKHQTYISHPDANVECINGYSLAVFSPIPTASE